MEKIQTIARTNPAETAIDPRSFHCFRFGEEPFLFDRATCSLVHVDNLTFGVLARMEEGKTFDESVAGLGLDEEDETALADALRMLVGRGFFRYMPVDHKEQAALIAGLMRHRPRRIQLLMAQGCNLGCRYCYAWRNGSNQKGTLMPFEVAKASVDHLVRRSGSRTDLQVTFFGGEPLLNYETIRQVVSYCRGLERISEKRFTFELITNGTLLTKDVTEWIVLEKFLLFISIDGWKEMHNYNRPAIGGADVYDVILSNALYAHRRYEEEGLPPLKVRANLTNRFHDASKVGEYLSSLGFKVIGVGAIEPLPHGDPSPSAMTEDQMDDLHEQLQEDVLNSLSKLGSGEQLTPFANTQLGKSLGQISTRRLKGITCGVARNTAVVDNKGNIYPCHRYEGMENYILGNVFDGMSTERTLAYYNKVNGNATNRCHSCWIRDYCAGGCAWLLSAKDGHLADPTERECNRRRKSIEMLLGVRQHVRRHFPGLLDKEEIDISNWDWAESEGSGADSDSASSKCSCGCENCGPTGCSN